jgi:hypothetical protein
VAIQLAGLLRRCTSANELTLFVIAKESRFAGRLRQSTGAIDQLVRHVASLRLMNTRLVITSLAPPGVVIQLDGHAAERLAMTPLSSLPYQPTARRWSPLPQPQNSVSDAHVPSVKLSLRIVHVSDDFSVEAIFAF